MQQHEVTGRDLLTDFDRKTEAHRENLVALLPPPAKERYYGASYDRDTPWVTERKVKALSTRRRRNKAAKASRRGNR